jgi:hypothetical protein
MLAMLLFANSAFRNNLLAFILRSIKESHRQHRQHRQRFRRRHFFWASLRKTPKALFPTLTISH